MKEEISSLLRHGTFKLTKLPAGRRAIGCKWVYRIKRDDTGKIVRYKARLVAQGFTQRKGTDFHEVFAPVARMTSQRIVMAIAAIEGLDLFTIDVDNAYLNGEIDATLYMKQPQGFVDPRYPDTSVWVCQLLKGLYGLKQAGNIWNAAVHAYLLEIGFRRADADLCIYTKSHEGGRIAISLHVDDFLTAATQAQFAWFVEMMLKRFSIKYSQATMCLGMRIAQIKDGYAFDQQHYLETLLKEFGMQDCKPAATPLAKGEVDALVSGGTGGKKLDPKDHHLYRQIVGKLMYAMVGSRPDLAHALSVLGRYSDSPDTYHLAMARRALAYVKGTLTLKMYYRTRGSNASGNPKLVGYVDSDYANSPDRKSTTGLCFYLEGCLVQWCSKRQTTIATSTTVAEYFALYEASTEAVCLRTLLSDLSIPQKEATLIREDNQTAIKLAEDETSHKRTKHISVKYHYTKEQQDLGVITIAYVPSEENIADFFTKPLARVQHQNMCKQLGLFS